MAKITKPKLKIAKGTTFSKVSITFNVKINTAEFKWLVTTKSDEVQAVIALYGKDSDEGGQDHILFSYHSDLDALEEIKGAKEAVTKSLPVLVEFKIPNKKLDEDKAGATVVKKKPMAKVATLRAVKKVKPKRPTRPVMNTANLKADIDEIYAVVYLSIKKRKGQAFEAFTPVMSSSVVKRRF